MNHRITLGFCTATLLALGACGGGGSGNASPSATAASTSASGTTTTTTTTTTTVVVVTTAPGTTASSPSTTASSPSTIASSPSTTASSPSTTASSPSTTASSPTSVGIVPTGASGLWNGATSTSRRLFGLVLPDGNYYLFYSGVGTASFSGILIGHGTAATGTFIASPDAYDYSLEGNGATSATMPGTSFVAGTSLSGTLHYAGSDVTFTAAYDSRYATTPTLSSLAGTYTGASASLTTGGGTANIVIATNGSVVGTAPGCDVTGTITARTDANAFDATLLFGPAPCALAGQTLTGAAFYDTVHKQLYLAAPTANRGDGFLVIATKP